MARRRALRARNRRLEHVLLVLLLVVSAIGFSRSSKTDVSAAPPPAPAVARAPQAEPLDPLVTPEPLARSVTMRQTRIAGRGFGYCANGSIDVPPTEATRVIVVMHGNDRQPCSVAAAVLAAGTPEQRSRTLVVSPWFPVREDRINPNTHLYWSFYSWSQGDRSANNDASISSYAVVDEMLDRVRHLPIVVAGFSGGGQFVARYAAGTSHEPVRFIITNPSSYLYWDDQRPGVSPEQLAACPTFNDYRYGLNKLNDYMADAGELNLKRRFGERRIIYLLGDADNDPRSSSMDRSCAAGAQGAHRFERGERYWAYLPSVFGPQIHTRHRKIVVPRVSHNVHAMFQHPDSRVALYG
ncbi:hypothetical protein [Granulicoccus sp. GXG6511]|uniref:hypothetical protein n=1 Tax=Granulicoccus sp. GXG6511 TaxID=3381351 RepID=UPI003D7D549F